MGEAPHILIVEDQANTAEMLTSYFEAQGYEVTAVGWGKDALSFLEKSTPDLIMLDIRLPDIDGYEVFRQMRVQRRTEHVPVIFLTERHERGDRLAGLDLGAADYVTKPFDVQELRLRVRNVLRRSTRGQLSHPITGLPSAMLVEERLAELPGSPDWELLVVALRGLDGFAEAYGFVARDDVMRAVALMLNHVVRDSEGTGTFIGHLDDTSFCIILSSGSAEGVQRALEVRLSEAMSFFYPRADWDAKQQDPAMQVPQLDVAMGVVGPLVDYEDVVDLTRAIAEAVEGQGPA